VSPRSTIGLAADDGRDVALAGLKREACYGRIKSVCSVTDGGGITQLEVGDQEDGVWYIVEHVVLEVHAIWKNSAANLIRIKKRE
jgi:hypothetical protein